MDRRAFLKLLSLATAATAAGLVVPEPERVRRWWAVPRGAPFGGVSHELDFEAEGYAPGSIWRNTDTGEHWQTAIVELSPGPNGQIGIVRSISIGEDDWSDASGNDIMQDLREAEASLDRARDERIRDERERADWHRRHPGLLFDLAHDRHSAIARKYLQHFAPEWRVITVKA